MKQTVKPGSLRLALLLLMSLFAAVPSAALAESKPALARLELDRDQIPAGGTVRATYVFRSGGPTAEDMTVFVHVVRPDGRRFGADFTPLTPTTDWPKEGFVSEGPFPIAVPANAPPGRYRILVGLFSPGGRAELDNPAQHAGALEYFAGSFETLPAGAPAPAAKPSVFSWRPVDEAKVVRPPAPLPGLPALDRLEVTLGAKTLYPVREKGASTKASVTAFYSDGTRRPLSTSEAKLSAVTKHASGGVQVVSLEGDRVVAKEGGVATVKASYAEGGRRATASADIVVVPYYRDYHQTLVMKLFLGMEGEPVERLAKDPVLSKKGHDLIHDFEGALEIIRQTDNLTRGIPKIVYLVGWQKGGHDHGYPAWSEVNPRMKRQQDATALDSLRWLIREARQFNTTVSLHLNMLDAYRQSPLWEEYVAKDCFAKDANGQLLVAGIQMKGEDMYNVVYPREWEAGLAQRRIDGLIQMIPELKEGHTIHVDVFLAWRDGAPISPWHAKPENGGLTPDKYVETQRKIFHYWRDRGFDVTGEGTGWAHPPGEHFVGLQAMSWWYSWDPMQIPERLGARGRTDRGGDGDFRFGSSMHGEDIWQDLWVKGEKGNMSRIQSTFCRTTLPWYWLGRFERLKLDGEDLIYSDGVVARIEAGKRVIRKGDFVAREDDNLFVPALWNGAEILAYSEKGYSDKSWRLPEDWKGTESVDVYKVTAEGLAPLRQGLSVSGGKLALSLGPGQCVSILPAGAKPAGRATSAAASGVGAIRP